jgi:Domain of unknown function (DUF4440)
MIDSATIKENASLCSKGLTTNIRVLGLDKQLMSALARMDEAAARPLITDGLVWTHVNARYTDAKDAVLEPFHNGDGFYTSIEPYDVTARDYGTFVILTGSSRIDTTYKGERLLIDCRFTDVWANVDGKWAMRSRHTTNKGSVLRVQQIRP